MNSEENSESRRGKTGIWSSLAAGALCAALAGAALAWFGGRLWSDGVARSELSAAAAQLIRTADRMGDELDAALDRINQSPFEFCSDAEVRMLRGLSFEARMLKDAGRVRDGKLYCSGTLGRLPVARPMPVPSMVTVRGHTVYGEVTTAMSKSLRATVFQRGEADVVVSPDAFLDVVPPAVQYMVSIAEAAGGRVVRGWGAAMEAFPGDPWQPGLIRVGDQLQYNACSSRHSLCAATMLNRADIRHRHAGVLAMIASVGAAAGLLAWALGVALWRHGRSLESRLRRALRRRCLSVVYQPIVELGTGRVQGAEALVRWHNDQGIEMSTEAFIAIAEEKGFISDITRFVLARCTAELGPLLRSRPDLRVTVNVAASDIADDAFFEHLDTCVRRAGLSAAQIGVELTERSTAERSVAVRAIGRLRERGHAVYIDDFGTGYSSLSYLTELDVDIIKVDRAFTRTVCTGAVTAAIVPQIVEMGRTLHLGIAIEGIETREQAAYFAELGGRLLAQGRYFAHPMPAGELMAWLAAHEQRLGAR